MKVVSVSSALALAAVVLLGGGCIEHQITYTHQIVSELPQPAPPPVDDIVVPRSARLIAVANFHVITQAPPPAQVEVVGTPPNSQNVWLPGYWQWRGSWVWVSGHWVTRPEPHAVWVPGHWTYRQNGYVWVHGYWRKAST